MARQLEFRDRLHGARYKELDLSKVRGVAGHNRFYSTDTPLDVAEPWRVALPYPRDKRMQQFETTGLGMTEARLILICGLPGSGKTTLATRLAPAVPAVRFCPDEWKHDLGIDYYDEKRRVRLEQRLWRLGQELLGLGQSVILENGFWAREERDELRLVGRNLGVAVELHYLAAPVDELWRRLEIRNELALPGTVPIKREDLEKWAQQFEAPDAAELALFDEAAR